MSEVKIIRIKFLDKHKKIPRAKLPFRGSSHSACWDVYATSKEVNNYGKVVKYGLGFAVELPPMTQLDFRPRSSIWKTGLVLSNSIGTIDEDYRGEISAVFYHMIPELPEYEVGDRIGQIQLVNRQDVLFVEVGELSDTVRGDGGFGSTGK